MGYNVKMEFIESNLFTKNIRLYLTDNEYAKFQWNLAFNPTEGDVIPGTGGLRKIRWVTKGRGKRGGIRIIYYYKNLKDQIWLLTVYTKSEVENISVSDLLKIKEELKL